MINPLKISEMLPRPTRCRRKFSASWPRPWSRNSGGGAVTATMNGKKQLSKLRIEPAAVIGLSGDKPDVEMLEDLVVAAVNEAGRKADEAMQSSVQGNAGRAQAAGA
jgi:nucleoid-associated protein EbfC